MFRAKPLRVYWTPHIFAKRVFVCPKPGGFFPPAPPGRRAVEQLHVSYRQLHLSNNPEFHRFVRSPPRRKPCNNKSANKSGTPRKGLATRVRGQQRILFGDACVMGRLATKPGLKASSALSWARHITIATCHCVHHTKHLISYKSVISCPSTTRP